IRLLKTKLTALEQQGEWDENVPASTVLVEPATDPDEGDKMKVFILQSLGLAAGIIAAHYSGIRLFSSFLTALGQPELPHSVDFILTGLLIGGGSGPMHVLVKFITQHKITTSEVDISEEESQSRAEDKKIPAPAVPATPILPLKDQWIEIPYNGGVDRNLLEIVHLRERNPDLIIFHHTAMHNKTRFEDIVRIIKNKTDSAGNHWLTGYNCIVSAEGTIHPFCRWDRYGNHTAGYNMHSLGIALNGNFETDPRVPGANADQCFGPARPSESQLKNAARVVTLWCLLYDIEPDYDWTILPHHAISSKSCPGSAFPYAEFQRWIDYFYKTWRQSDYVKQQIEIYKLKPFLYVEQGKEA
ncbi:MAG: peptidoglycan recognition family protein, partial [bacterium]|nr:peptidoglycan recognition family protein [bacterium]